MIQSDIDSAAILVVVDTPNFAGAVVQVLRNCAPFPIRAAVTNSLEQALAFLKTTEVDLILIDAFLPSCAGSSSLCRLRQASVVPAIAFARAPNDDVEHYLMKCGAQAVLPRDSLDAMMLVGAVREILGHVRLEKPVSHVVDDQAESRIVSTSANGTGESASLVLKNHIAGVARLQQILSSEKAPTEPQLQQLRKLLGKYSNNNFQ